jgi:hypothetical protein
VMINSTRNTSTISDTDTDRRENVQTTHQRSRSQSPLLPLHVFRHPINIFEQSLIPSCQQILTANQPGTQDSHGCPFRHFSPDSLSSFLISTYPTSFDRSGQELREVMDHVKNTHYHLACTRVFEVTKGIKKGEGLGVGGEGENVTHPNKYADASRALEK